MTISRLDVIYPFEASGQSVRHVLQLNKTDSLSSSDTIPTTMIIGSLDTRGRDDRQDTGGEKRRKNSAHLTVSN